MFGGMQIDIRANLNTSTKYGRIAQYDNFAKNDILYIGLLRIGQLGLSSMHAITYLSPLNVPRHKWGGII